MQRKKLESEMSEFEKFYEALSVYKNITVSNTLWAENRGFQNELASLNSSEITRLIQRTISYNRVTHFRNICQVVINVRPDAIDILDAVKQNIPSRGKKILGENRGALLVELNDMLANLLSLDSKAPKIQTLPMPWGWGGASFFAPGLLSAGNGHSKEKPLSILEEIAAQVLAQRFQRN